MTTTFPTTPVDGGGGGGGGGDGGGGSSGGEALTAFLGGFTGRRRTSTQQRVGTSNVPSGSGKPLTVGTYGASDTARRRRRSALLDGQSGPGDQPMGPG